jgi:hypothetical protein
MKRAGGLCILFFGATGLFAQHAGAPASRGGGGGSAPRPSGHGAIPIPHTPNVIYPASGTPVRSAPVYRNNYPTVYAYPVYVPYGGYGSGYYDNSYAPAATAPDGYYQQPNMNMSYPPPSYPPDSAQMRTYANPYVDPDSDGPPPMQSDNSAASHYLIAINDHTIYAAVAYYVDGDTLHYFTDGNIHNQVSISSIDRDLTARLNKESGKTVDLTPVKQ